MADKQNNYFEELETAVSKPKRSKASPRPKSASRKGKSHSAKGLPYKSGVGSGSVPPRTARELWLSAVKSGLSAGSISKKRHQGRPTPTELWTETLKQTTGNTESFTGLLKSQTQNMSYSSTSHYLRQRAGIEKSTTPRQLQNGKSAPGTPAYKSKEEYYDEVLTLKKQIQALNLENSTQKSKIRRLEEDNIKKEKQIEQLLDPSKNEEIRRTLSDRRPDTSTVIHSLKQKILKLEHQLKDKETTLSKLQSDLKTTKYEELKEQAEMFYREIKRLNQLLATSSDLYSSKAASAGIIKETPSRLKALQETIKRMNDKNVRLMGENKALKEDLDKLLQEKATLKSKHNEYEDMTKKELLNAIAKLEKRLDRAEADGLSLNSNFDARRPEREGKITLEGTLAQRLDQLDQRETELLEELDKQRELIKRLKEDRAHYRKKCDEKEKEIKTLKKEIEDLQAELDSFYERDKSETPRRPSRQPSPKQATVPRAKPKSRAGSVTAEQVKKVESFRENYAAKKIQKQWRSHRETEAKVQQMHKEHSARVIQRSWKNYNSNIKKEKAIHQFRENRAARKIQAGWKQHKQHKQEAEIEDAAELIQGALRGYKTHQRNMSRMRGYVAEPDVTSTTVTATESELEDAADVIQTSLRGYNFRKKQINKIAPVRSSFSKSSPTRKLNSEGEEEGQEDSPPPSARRMSGRGSVQMRRPSSGRVSTPSSRRNSVKSQRSSPPRKSVTSRYDDDDDSDEDDIVMPSARKTRLF